MKYSYTYKTKIGDITIVEEDDCIIAIDINGKYNESEVKETLLIKKAHKQLEEYFDGKRRTFDFPLNLKGTEFQMKVWNALKDIPYGETRSYKDIAIAINNEKACRAVGGANNKNPIPIVIPCHRVIGAKGDLVGFGCGLDVKIKLLEIEKNKK